MKRGFHFRGAAATFLFGLCASSAAAAPALGPGAIGLSGTFDGNAATGVLNYDVNGTFLTGDNCVDGDACLTLSAVTAFSLSFEDADFTLLDPFGLDSLLGDPSRIVLVLDGDVPAMLELDIAFGPDLMLSVATGGFNKNTFTFTFSSTIDPRGTNQPGTGSTGSGGGDAVVPLPATLPLLLGALGLGGLVFRRRAA